jgi:hypothetical protein
MLDNHRYVDNQDEMAGLYRRVTAATLILAPAIFLVGNVFHPREFTRDHEARQLAETAAHYTRWQAVHASYVVVAMLFAAAIAGLAFMVSRRRPLLGLAGGAFGIAGLIALGGVAALDGFTWGILGEVSSRPGVDAHSVQLALHDVQQSGWNLPFYVGSLGFPIGVATLGIGAARTRAIPAWAGGLLALGGAMVGVEGAVGDNTYFIVSAAVLFAGGLATGLAIHRMSDADFALTPGGGSA